MPHGGDVRGRSGLGYGRAQPVGIVGLVREQDGAGLEMAEQIGGDRTISGLARREDQLQRPAECVGQRVHLGGQPAARAAHTAIRVAFFELAAC